MAAGAFSLYMGADFNQAGKHGVFSTERKQRHLTAENKFFPLKLHESRI
jgi:hypothetical protein